MYIFIHFYLNLPYIDNLQIPANHERYWKDHTGHDVHQGVDLGLGVGGQAGGLALHVVGGQGTYTQQWGQGGGQAQQPEHQDEQHDPLAGQDRGVPAHSPDFGEIILKMIFDNRIIDHLQD